MPVGSNFVAVKYLIIILLMTGLLLQSLSRTFVLAGFEMNREYISKNLCVQRAKKNNTCKGSCHLKKKLEQQEDKQGGTLPAKNLKEDVEIYCQVSFSFPFSHHPQPASEYHEIPEPLVISASFSIFHPPKSVPDNEVL